MIGLEIEELDAWAIRWRIGSIGVGPGMSRPRRQKLLAEF